MPTITQPWGNSYYEEWGDPDGPPLVLLNGLGYARWSWYRQRQQLPGLRIIVWEHRGMGGSDESREPYSLADLADDVARGLDALGIKRAAIFGVSLGGMVAQEFVIGHASRCAALILGCTTSGGSTAVPMSAATIERMTRLAQSGWGREGMREGLDMNFSSDWLAENPEAVEEFLDLRVSQLPSMQAWLLQRRAGLAFDASERLHEAYAGPVLLLHGSADEVVPYGNLGVLRELLPQADVQVYPEARHLFWVEHAERVNSRVTNFCLQNQPG